MQIQKNWKLTQLLIKRSIITYNYHNPKRQKNLKKNWSHVLNEISPFGGNNFPNKFYTHAFVWKKTSDASYVQEVQLNAFFTTA